jgi:hypothetical protein
VPVYPRVSHSYLSKAVDEVPPPQSLPLAVVGPRDSRPSSHSVTPFPWYPDDARLGEARHTSPEP